jgi:hypothetical protein
LVPIMYIHVLIFTDMLSMFFCIYLLSGTAGSHGNSV